MDPMIEGMARAFFVCEWSDNEERAGRLNYPSGTELMDVAPETPRGAYDAAQRFAEHLEAANRTSLSVILWNASRADGNDPWADYKIPDSYARDLGHYLAMQAMGHGVSWFDDHARFEIKVPYFEPHAFDFELDYAEEDDT